MRTSAVLFALFATGCLGQIVPEHHEASAAPDPGPMDSPPAGDDGGVAPDLAPGPSGPIGRDGIDGGAAQVPVLIQLDSDVATLTAPMTTLSDGNASGGTYVMVPAGGTGGKAIFTFNLPAEADY